MAHYDHRDEWRYTEGVVDIGFRAAGTTEPIACKGRRLSLSYNDEQFVSEGGFPVTSQSAVWFVWAGEETASYEALLPTVKPGATILDHDSRKWRVLRATERVVNSQVIGWRLVATREDAS